MRVRPSIFASAGALALAAAVLTGCGPTGTDSDVVQGQPVAVNPELSTLPDIDVVTDIAYGSDPAQVLDACLPPPPDQPAPPQTDAPGADLPQPDEPLRAAIVVVHGGSWARGDKADIAWRAVCQWLASAGYVAFSVDYRLAPKHIFPAAFDDVSLAVRWLREPAQLERFQIDPDRIGAFGGSAGANLVALLGTEGSGSLTTGSRVAAVAELSGPIDLTGLATTDDFVPVQLAYLGCPSEEDCPNAVAASPFYQIDPTDPPFFVGHSSAERIPLAQAEIFVAGLRAAGVSVDFVTVEGTLHSIAMLDADLKKRIVEFFDDHIGTPDAPVVGDDGG
ncbi:MAG TPA: alpha/beta hydrolase [Pseudolysinimonas sp.]|jgi:acetyl esterase/lipase|nr:alpha/beta hydrolase [Pseudolysinimonas sp.]